MTNVQKVQLKYGKIKQADIDAMEAKAKAVDDALAAYTAGKATMTKTQIAACLDAIVANKTALKTKAGK